jgi:hypothetical protein
MFSHKISMWATRGGDPLLPWSDARSHYQVSMHFVTREMLEYALVTSSTMIISDISGGQRTFQDYRQTSPLRQDVRRAFDARPLPVDVKSEPAAGGELRSSWLYLIDESERYRPGLLQVMLLPPRRLLWDGLDVGPQLEAFQHKVGDRLRHERRLRSDDIIRPTFSMVRRESLAPHIIEALDYAD